jgi:type III pantothenate kinase
MKPHLVADIGNTRIKWGLCAPSESKILRLASLPEDPEAWEQQRAEWFPPETGPLRWVLASVQPERGERLKDWCRQRGDEVVVLSRASQLPLTVGLAEPDKAGIDRLLNAVSARSQLLGGQPAILVGVGSAVTVDWLDEAHVFRGGAIFPGLGLMARALHEHTALLPRVTVLQPLPPLPGSGTIPAMQAGIFWAVAGGIAMISRNYCDQSSTPPRLFVTGGDGEFVLKYLSSYLSAGWLSELKPTWWPKQTLEGILRSAEAMP